MTKVAVQQRGVCFFCGVVMIKYVHRGLGELINTHTNTTSGTQHVISAG